MAKLLSVKNTFVHWEDSEDEHRTLRRVSSEPARFSPLVVADLDSSETPGDAHRTSEEAQDVLHGSAADEALQFRRPALRHAATYPGTMEETRAWPSQRLEQDTFHLGTFHFHFPQPQWQMPTVLAPGCQALAWGAPVPFALGVPLIYNPAAQDGDWANGLARGAASLRRDNRYNDLDDDEQESSDGESEDDSDIEDWVDEVMSQEPDMNRTARQRRTLIPAHVVPLAILGAIQKGEICPISMEPLTPEDGVMTPCGHLFNRPAVERSLRQSGCCPVCREPCGPRSLQP